MEVFHIRKYRRFPLSAICLSWSWRRFLEPILGYSILGTQKFSGTGIRRSGSCLGLGGKWYLSIFPQQFAPYFSISSSISGNNLCTQVNRGCSFSAGIPRAGQRSTNLCLGFFIGYSPTLDPSERRLFCRELSLGDVSLGSWRRSL